jgi:hypothetical protein
LISGRFTLSFSGQKNSPSSENHIRRDITGNRFCS